MFWSSTHTHTHARTPGRPGRSQHKTNRIKSCLFGVLFFFFTLQVGVIAVSKSWAKLRLAIFVGFCCFHPSHPIIVLLLKTKNNKGFYFAFLRAHQPGLSNFSSLVCAGPFVSPCQAFGDGGFFPFSSLLLGSPFWDGICRSSRGPTAKAPRRS